MRRSHAQEALNRTEYTEGMDIQDHIKLLRTRKAAVDNLTSSVMSDETWRGIIIRSIPPTANWLPVIPSLYTMATSADIISTLFAHGMILARYTTTRTGANSSNTVLAIKTTNSDPDGCTNPGCKAKIRSSHTTANCYWPGEKRVNFHQILAQGPERVLSPPILSKQDILHFQHEFQVGIPPDIPGY